MKKQIKIRAERTKAISFFLALSLLLLVGIPENVESQCCCDPICYPSWLTDAFSWVAKKTVEGAVWLYNTFLPTENEKEAYEKFKKNYNNLVEEQKEQLEFLSDEKNVRELMNSGITPEKFDDFLDYCFPSLEDLKNAASCEEKKANQRAAIDVSLAVGGMATAGVGKVVGGAAETAADIVGTSATVYGAIGPVKELLGPETFDKIIQENELGYAVRSAEALSGSYRKAYDNYIKRY